MCPELAEREVKQASSPPNYTRSHVPSTEGGFALLVNSLSPETLLHTPDWGPLEAGVCEEVLILI